MDFELDHVSETISGLFVFAESRTLKFWDSPRTGKKEYSLELTFVLPPDHYLISERKRLVEVSRKNFCSDPTTIQYQFADSLSLTIVNLFRLTESTRLEESPDGRYYRLILCFDITNSKSLLDYCIGNQR
jgi:hypothetical protein